MGPLSLIGGVIAFIFGLIVFIMFVMLCINIGTIRKNIQSIYTIEFSRGVKDGIVNNEGKPVKTKAMAPNIAPPGAASNEVKPQGWTCPNCSHLNHPGDGKCEKCGMEMP